LGSSRGEDGSGGARRVRESREHDRLAGNGVEGAAVEAAEHLDALEADARQQALELEADEVAHRERQPVLADDAAAAVALVAHRQVQELRRAQVPRRSAISSPGGIANSDWSLCRHAASAASGFSTRSSSRRPATVSAAASRARPWLGRDEVLVRIEAGLVAKGIYSTGRFGAWRYEVSNQDHSAMHGVEMVDNILFGTAENTVLGRMDHRTPKLISKAQAASLTRR